MGIVEIQGSLKDAERVKEHLEGKNRWNVSVKEVEDDSRDRRRRRSRSRRRSSRSPRRSSNRESRNSKRRRSSSSSRRGRKSSRERSHQSERPQKQQKEPLISSAASRLSMVHAADESEVSVVSVSSSRQKEEKVREVWVGNLPSGMTEKKLYQHFFIYGEIENIELYPQKVRLRQLSLLELRFH